MIDISPDNQNELLRDLENSFAGFPLGGKRLRSTKKTGEQVAWHAGNIHAKGYNRIVEIAGRTAGRAAMGLLKAEVVVGDMVQKFRDRDRRVKGGNFLAAIGAEIDMNQLQPRTEHVTDSLVLPEQIPAIAPADLA